MNVLRRTGLIVALGAGACLAQSNGNFSATGSGASCAIGANGALSGGIVGNSFVTNISTSGGQGVTLDIRPSFVTGLFTDTKISTTVPSASSEVGIQVCVSVDGSGAGVLPTSCVIYDERFQQISSQLFSQLSACTMLSSGVACTTNPDCTNPSFPTCNNPTGGTLAGVCVGPNPACNFELILSTLSAHSFDFVVPVDNKKPHTVTTTWNVINASGNQAACVGPGITTVTQVKTFNNSGTLAF